MSTADKYLKENILNILRNGYMDENPRPKYADGTPAHTKSVNHVVRHYDLSKGEFPITTLRKIAWKSAIKETLWIYKDQSNNLDVLKNEYGVNYWDSWESNKIPRTIGVRYGETIRRYNLIEKLIKSINEDPYGRRKVMDLWQEVDFQSSDGLLPCAFCTIWNVRGEYLDMALIQRSGDMLVASGAGGVNEVQYAALLMMVSQVTGYKPGIFTHFVANEQIYDRHYEQAEELLNRIPSNVMPKMSLNPDIKNIKDFTIEDFQLDNYFPCEEQLKFELGI